MFQYPLSIIHCLSFETGISVILKIKIIKILVLPARAGDDRESRCASRETVERWDSILCERFWIRGLESSFGGS